MTAWFGAWLGWLAPPNLISARSWFQKSSPGAVTASAASITGSRPCAFATPLMTIGFNAVPARATTHFSRYGVERQ